MPNPEKKVIAELISSFITFGAYGVYIFGKYSEAGPEVIHDLVFWAKAFLWLIPVGIVAGIFIIILLVILNRIFTGEAAMIFMDERDKMIELKAGRISAWFFIMGVFFSMGTIVMGYPAGVFVISMAVGGFISNLAGSVIQLFYYHRGVA